MRLIRDAARGITEQTNWYGDADRFKWQGGRRELRIERRDSVFRSGGRPGLPEGRPSDPPSSIEIGVVVTNFCSEQKT